MKKVDLMVLIMVIAGHPSNSVKDHNSINFIMEIITGYSIDASIGIHTQEMLLITLSITNTPTQSPKLSITNTINYPLSTTTNQVPASLYRTYQIL